MTTTIQLNANELDKNFLTAVKALFQDRKITVTIDAEMDETEYLMSSEANRQFLMESIEQARRDELIEIDPQAWALDERTRRSLK